MQTVLLTGATGFLGSHLLQALIAEGYKTVIVKRSTSDTWRIDDYLDKVDAYNIDEFSFHDIFAKQNIDTVIHTVCHYGRNNCKLSQIVESNLMLGIRLLENCMEHGVKIFINTDTVLPRTINDYSLSKQQFSEWLKQYSSALQAVNMRIEHMYGLNDDNSKFVPWLLDRIIGTEEQIGLTKGEQKRDFINVKDVVSAYMLVLKNIERLEKWSEFDVGTDALITIREFVKLITRIFMDEYKIDISTRFDLGAVPYRENEIMVPDLHTVEIRKLGWKPVHSLESGVKELIRERM